jgi:hypothetical protein
LAQSIWRKVFGAKQAVVGQNRAILKRRTGPQIRMYLERLEERTTPTVGALGAEQHLGQAYGQLPLSFEANAGQADAQVQYLSRGTGYSLALTPGGAFLNLHKSAGQASSASTALQISLVGANPLTSVEGVDPLPGLTNYLVGKDPSQWRTNIANYSRVEYQDVYAGINLVYYGNQQQLEYDFVVAPGVDPGAIRFAIRGAGSMQLDDQGNLVVQVAEGQVIQRAPVLYQEIGEARRAVSGKFVLLDQGTVGFQIGSYDHSLPLTIDPILSYSTYLGGSLNDAGAGIAVDSSGNAYVVGTTSSTDFPTIDGSPLTSAAGAQDVFVSKLNDEGTALAYSTFLGGSSDDLASAITLDDSGNAYVVGMTSSADFPTTSGAFQTSLGSPYKSDAFVAKLNATGTSLIYSTYLGGTDTDMGMAVAVDGSGNAFVAGSAASIDFPTTTNALQTTSSTGGSFVTQLNASGTALVYSTYLVGTHYSYDNHPQDGATGIAVDAAGNAYVVGSTSFTDFPTTAGAYQTDLQGVTDAFVVKLNASGSSPLYSTLLGNGYAQGNASGYDFANGIAIDSTGAAVVVGYTGSDLFPTTSNALQTAFGGYDDAFVSKLNPDGSALVYNTYLGGAGYDYGSGIALDSAGNAYVIGSTSSNNFPTTPDAYQSSLTGYSAAFFAKLDASGASLSYGTLLSGASYGASFGYGIALDSSNHPYLVGYTVSSDFPTTANAYQTTGGQGKDAFVAKLALPALTADAGGPYSIEEGNSLELDASNTINPTNYDLTYSWTINGHVDAAQRSQPSLSWSELQSLGIDDGPGAFEIVLTVDNGHGGVSTSDPVTLAIVDTAPTATLSNNGPVDEGNPVTISFSNATDPSTADTAAGFHYSFATSAADLASNYANATDGSSKPFTPGRSGTYTLYGRVFDKDDAYTDYQTAVTVQNLPPTIVSVVNDGPVIQGSPVTITVTATDPGGSGDALVYDFDFDNDGVYEVSNALGVATHTFAVGGDYPVSVRVRDADQAQASSATTVSVGTSSPNITLGGYLLTNVVTGSNQTLAGDATLPLAGSVRLSGTYVDTSHFSLSAPVPSLSLAGFSLANAVITLSDSGLGLSGATSVPGGITAHLIGTVQDATHYSLTASVPGMTLAGFALTNAVVTMSNGSVGLAGDATLPVAGSVHLQGSIQDSSHFTLTVSLPTLTVAGFTLTDTLVTLSDAGLKMASNASLPLVGNLHLEGTIQDASHYHFDAPVPGFSITGFSFNITTVKLSADGLNLTGDTSLPLVGAVHLDGEIQDANHYDFSATVPDLNLLGFSLTHTIVDLSQVGVGLVGDANLPLVGNVHLEGAIQDASHYSLNVTVADLTLAGFTLTSVLVTLSDSGVALTGDATLPLVGTVHLGGPVQDASHYKLSVAVPDVTLAGFSLTHVVASLSASGFSLKGDATLPLIGAVHDLEGLVTGATDFSLSVPLPSVTIGTFTLSDNSITLSADGVTITGHTTLAVVGPVTFTGNIFTDGTFSITAAPGPLSLLGGLVQFTQETFTLTTEAVTVEADAEVLQIGQAHFKGSIYFDGHYTLGATITIHVAGFTVDGANLNFGSDKLDVDFTLPVPEVGEVSFRGSYGAGGHWSLGATYPGPVQAGPVTLTDLGFDVSDTSLKLFATGSFADIEALVNVKVEADIYYDGRFQATVDAHVLELGGFSLGQAVVTFGNDHPNKEFIVDIHAFAGIGSVGPSVKLDGTFHDDGYYELIGTEDIALGGLSLTKTEFTLKKGAGFAFSADWDYGVFYAHIKGSIGTDGRVQFDGDGGGKLAGFDLGGVHVGVDLNPAIGHFSIDVGVHADLLITKVDLGATLSYDAGSWQALSFDKTIAIPAPFSTLVSSSVHLKFDRDGAVFDTSFSSPYLPASFDVHAAINSDGSVAIKGDATLPLLGKATLDGRVTNGSDYSFTATLLDDWSMGSWSKGLFPEFTATLDSQNGVRVTGAINLPAGLGKGTFSGAIAPNGAFSIAVTLGASPSLGSWGNLVSVNASATLTNTSVTVAGSINLPAGLGNASFSGTVATSGSFSFEVTLGAGRSLGSWGGQVSLNASATLTNTSVTVGGSINLPAGLGSASFSGTVATSGSFSFEVTLGAGRSLGSWGGQVSLNASATLTNTSVTVGGSVNLPAGLGSASFSGTVATNGSFSFVITLGSSRSLGSWGGKISVNASATLTNTSVSVGGSVNLPAGLGSASFSGTVATSGSFSFVITLGSSRSLGSWGSGISVNASATLTNTSVTVGGSVNLPVGLGSASFSGTVATTGYFAFDIRLGSGRALGSWSRSIVSVNAAATLSSDGVSIGGAVSLGPINTSFNALIGKSGTFSFGLGFKNVNAGIGKLSANFTLSNSSLSFNGTLTLPAIGKSYPANGTVNTDGTFNFPGIGKFASSPAVSELVRLWKGLHANFSDLARALWKGGPMGGKTPLDLAKALVAGGSANASDLAKALEFSGIGYGSIAYAIGGSIGGIHLWEIASALWDYTKADYTDIANALYHGGVASFFPGGFGATDVASALSQARASFRQVAKAIAGGIGGVTLTQIASILWNARIGANFGDIGDALWNGGVYKYFSGGFNSVDLVYALSGAGGKLGDLASGLKRALGWSNSKALSYLASIGFGGSSGGGGGGIGDIIGALTGINGYPLGAVAFFDANKSGILDPNEPWAVTDAHGAFSILVPQEFDTNSNGALDDSEGQWVIEGGVDITTGAPAPMLLIAPASWKTVTPLTTLVTMLSASGSMSLADASSRVLTALSIPQVNLSNFDPEAEAVAGNPVGAQFFGVHARLADTVALVASLFAEPGTQSPDPSLVSIIQQAIVERLKTSNLDLGDASQIAALIGSVATSTGHSLSSTLIAGAGEVSAAANRQIDVVTGQTGLTYIQQVAQIKQIAQTVLAGDLWQAASGQKDIDSVVAADTGSALGAQIGLAKVRPILTTAAPLVVEADDATGAHISFDVHAVDIAGQPLAVTYDHAPGSLFPLGETVVTATATDSLGNVASDTFTVTVVDTTAPLLTAPADQTVEATSPGGAMVTLPVLTATDLVDPAPLVTYDPPSGSFPLGTTLVTATATDAAGNKSIMTFSITVVDSTGPVIVAPADLVVLVDGPGEAEVSLPAVTATDAADSNVVISYDPPSGLFPPGITLVTVTATDASGNSSTANFHVFVVDGSMEGPIVPAITSTGSDRREASPITITGAAVDRTTASLLSGVDYSWAVFKSDSEGDTPFAQGAGTNSSFTFTPDDGGLYRIVLTVANSSGSATTEETIVVGDVAPTAALSNVGTDHVVGVPVQATASASDPSPVDQQAGFTFSWTVTRDGAEFASGSGASIAFIPDSAGTYLLSVIATDKDGTASLPAEATIIVDPNTLTANQRYIVAVYQDLLGRATDEDGLAYWGHQLDQGVARAALINLIDHSAEYFSRIIEPAYEQFLGRQPDEHGIAYWVQKMTEGLTDEQLEAGFIGSPEYYQHSGGADRAWVDAMYQNLLGRQPDQQGEDYWVTQLAAGANRASVAYGFAGSAEREGQHVMALYQKYLGRTAGQSEIDYWVDQFVHHGKTNEDVVTGFVGSDEYYRKHTGG